MQGPQEGIRLRYQTEVLSKQLLDHKLGVRKAQLLENIYAIQNRDLNMFIH